MEIREILDDKRKELLKTGNPLAVGFTIEDINTLADISSLRRLKLQLAFPDKFEQSSDLFACARSIIEGDSDYRVLEFCMLKNKVLRLPIQQVFSRIMKD